MKRTNVEKYCFIFTFSDLQLFIHESLVYTEEEKVYFCTNSGIFLSGVLIHKTAM